jgi:hypothetical protein
MLAPLRPLITPCTFCAAETPLISTSAVRDRAARNAILTIRPLFIILLLHDRTCIRSRFSGTGKQVRRRSDPVLLDSEEVRRIAGTWRGTRYFQTAQRRAKTQGPCGRAAMAKPEVLYSVAFGRTERRITFEAKESSLCEMAKRGETRGIAALGDHNENPIRNKLNGGLRQWLERHRR